jgi:zinc protease
MNFLHKILLNIFLFLFTFSLFAQEKPAPRQRPNVPHIGDKEIQVKEVPQPSKEMLEKQQLNEKLKNREKGFIDPLNLKEFTLNNGLKVYLSENHDVPQVFGLVVVKAGGKNDPADATGMAHYLEHMLFKGTTTLGTIDYEKEKPYLDKINDLYEQLGNTSNEEERKNIQKQINEQSILAGEYAIANEMDKLLSKIGSTDVNAFTTEDFTAYFNTFPSNQIDRWLDLYSHRFQEPVFRLFQSELETVYEEKNRGLDDTFGQVFEQFLKNFYKNHPYGQQDIIGSTEHLKNPPLKKMYEYFNNYYVANNMALILSGDFNTDEIFPIINEKFGKWRVGDVPEFPNFDEASFNGREVVTKNLTPIKVGILGFRAPKNGHDDATAMSVAINILSNAEQTGFIDKISMEGKIMQAGVFAIPYNDYGATLVFYVPKIIGQSHEAAEDIVKEAFTKLKAGDFSDEFLQAIKKNMVQEWELKWESNDERALEIANAFVQKRDWKEYVAETNRINKLTKEDIVRVANEYFSDNYLCFQSKMGKPNNEKLAKPNFEPVIPKNEAKSQYAQKFETIPTKNPSPKFVDFNNDISTIIDKKYKTFHATKNPFNNIFDIEIRYGVGKYDMPILEQTAAYLNLVGTDTKTASEIKEELYKIGASFYVSVNDESFSIFVSGNDRQIDATLKIIGNFILKAAKDEKQVKKVLEDFEVEKKFNRNEPSHIADALNQYALYDNKSSFKRQLNAKQLKKLTSDQLLNAFKEVQQYELNIYYTGNLALEKVQKIFNAHFPTHMDIKPQVAPVEIERKKTDKTIIYLVDRKNAVQSQIYFNIEGKPRDNNQIPYMNAFNNYFGEDMSSLVFQEIREFRSLAYSAYGRYRPAKTVGKNNLFVGYIGCQADKTLDAMNAMLELINNMPEKRERMDIISSSLKESANANRPGFRSLLKTVDTWKKAGYTEDPNKINLMAYEKINFDDIVNFYQNEVKQKPIIISIVGDAKRFDLKELAKYGEIIKVKESDLFVN